MYITAMTEEMGEVSEGVGHLVKSNSTHLSSFGIATKEMQWERSAQVEVECLQNAALHAANVCVRVRVVGDVLEVADLRRVHLLVLGRNQHGRDTNQLQLRALDALNLN